MKKKYKLLLILAIVAFTIIGLNYYSYHNYLNKQKERIELFFKYNYNNIDSLTFTKIKKNPTGSLNFHGYLNGNQEEKFIGKIMPDQKESERNNVINYTFAMKNAKFEDRKTYSVSEILKVQ